MKYSIACICGFETPAVENREDLDEELMDAHQEFCKVVRRIVGAE